MSIATNSNFHNHQIKHTRILSIKHNSDYTFLRIYFHFITSTYIFTQKLVDKRLYCVKGLKKLLWCKIKVVYLRCETKSHAMRIRQTRFVDSTHITCEINLHTNQPNAPRTKITTNDKDTFHMPGQHMPQSDGRNYLQAYR